MTQEQLYAEINALIAKNQIEQDNRISKDFKEAQKSSQAESTVHLLKPRG